MVRATRGGGGPPEDPPSRLCRHTYATAALQNASGWHEVKVISERLGHASVGITLDTYSHVLPAADKQTAHTLARVILGEPS